MLFRSDYNKRQHKKLLLVCGRRRTRALTHELESGHGITETYCQAILNLASIYYYDLELTSSSNYSYELNLQFP